MSSTIYIYFGSGGHNPQNQTDNYQFLLVNTSKLHVRFIYKVSLNYAVKFQMKCADKLLQTVAVVYHGQNCKLKFSELLENLES